LYQPYRATEFVDSDGNAENDPVDQCLLKEVGESGGCVFVVVRILQLVPGASDLAADSGDGSGVDRSPVERGRTGGDMMGSVMDAIIIRQVKCENCGEPTWLHDSTIEELIQRQSVMTNEGRRINFACPLCTVLTRSLLVQARYIPQGDISRFLAGRDSYIGSIVCAKPDCVSRVILLAPSKGEPDTAGWQIGDAACEEGQLPELPFQVEAWMRLP